MRTWVDLYDAHMTDISDCPIMTACDALRQSAQDFCDRTKVWRANLDPILTIPGMQFYEFDKSKEVDIVKIFSAVLAGREIPMHLDAKRGEQCVQPISPVMFAIYPAPAARGQRIVFDVALAPSYGSSGMEQWVLNKYAPIIAKGAKAILFAQSRKPYTDMNSSMDMRQQFDADVANVKGAIATAFSTAPVRVAAQFF